MHIEKIHEGRFRLIFQDTVSLWFVRSVAEQLDASIVLFEHKCVEFSATSVMRFFDFATLFDTKDNVHANYLPAIIARGLFTLSRQICYMMTHANKAPVAVLPDHMLVVDNTCWIIVNPCWSYVCNNKHVIVDNPPFSRGMLVDNSSLTPYMSPEIRDMSSIPATIPNTSWMFSIATICRIHLKSDLLVGTRIFYTLSRWASHDPFIREFK